MSQYTQAGGIKVVCVVNVFQLKCDSWVSCCCVKIKRLVILNYLSWYVRMLKQRRFILVNAAWFDWFTDQGGWSPRLVLWVLVGRPEPQSCSDGHLVCPASAFLSGIPLLVDFLCLNMNKRIRFLPTCTRSLIFGAHLRWGHLRWFRYQNQAVADDGPVLNYQIQLLKLESLTAACCYGSVKGDFYLQTFPNWSWFRHSTETKTSRESFSVWRKKTIHFICFCQFNRGKEEKFSINRDWSPETNLFLAPCFLILPAFDQPVFIMAE